MIITILVGSMINRNISVHLQDFPDVSFLSDQKELVENMDLVRVVCSTILSIRDNKNLRVRLPLNSVKVIAKNANKIMAFKEIISEEVNVKNVEFSEEISGIAELKLQVNFKKIGAKYGAKVKDITTAVKNNDFKKISDNEIEIAGVVLVGDEFELKLTSKNQDEKKYVTMPLPNSAGLVSLDIEVTKELEEEGISRDIVRAVQQSRKDANLNVSDRIKLKIFAKNKVILEVAEKFSAYIKDQVLAVELKLTSEEEIRKSQFSFESKIDDGEIIIGIN